MKKETIWQISEANKRQVGADHYKNGGEEHWDRVHRLKLDYFQGQITKYVERCWLKNGLQDLEKAQHFLQKYIELAKIEKEFEKEIAELKKPAVPYDDIPAGEFIVGEAKPEIIELPRSSSIDGLTGAVAPCCDDKPTVDEVLANRPEPGIANVIFPVVPGTDIDSLRFYQVGEVMPSGWVQFVFEGIQSEGALYTCRECNEHFNAPVDKNPHGYHRCRGFADACRELGPQNQVANEGEPTAGYVNQG